MTKEQIVAFLLEYEALCKKYGLCLLGDSPYHGTIISSLSEEYLGGDPFWDLCFSTMDVDGIEIPDKIKYDSNAIRKFLLGDKSGR